MYRIVIVVFGRIEILRFDQWLNTNNECSLATDNSKRHKRHNAGYTKVKNSPRNHSV